jgi:putative DNA primase/helicase
VLDPEVENPEARPFKRDLAAYVAEHRGELLSAVLTIPLAYLAAGAPSLQAPRSRFAEWDRFVRRPLLWLGEADPLETQALVRAADPERETLLAVLAAWRESFGEEPATVAAAIAAATATGMSENAQLLEALQGAAGERNGTINSRRLGRWLVRQIRRIEGAMRFEEAGLDRVTNRRRYSVTRVSSVAANPTRESGNSVVMVGINAENECNAAQICRYCSGEGCIWCKLSSPPK